MTPAGNLPSRPKQVTAAASICAVIAIFALIFVAEWVPDLLPYSPNLRLTSSSSAVRSPAFPAVCFVIATIAVASFFLLRRLHRYALLSVVILWITMIGSASYSCIQLRQTCGPRGALSIGVLILFGAMMMRAVRRNWPKQDN